jgi:hypothetical protein
VPTSQQRERENATEAQGERGGHEKKEVQKRAQKTKRKLAQSKKRARALPERAASTQPFLIISS